MSIPLHRPDRQRILTTRELRKRDARRKADEAPLYVPLTIDGANIEGKDGPQRVVYLKHGNADAGTLRDRLVFIGHRVISELALAAGRLRCGETSHYLTDLYETLADLAGTPDTNIPECELEHSHSHEEVLALAQAGVVFDTWSGIPIGKVGESVETPLGPPMQMASFCPFVARMEKGSAGRSIHPELVATTLDKLGYDDDRQFKAATEEQEMAAEDCHGVFELLDDNNFMSSDGPIQEVVVRNAVCNTVRIYDKVLQEDR